MSAVAMGLAKVMNMAEAEWEVSEKYVFLN